MIMRHICSVVIHVPRVVFYLSLRLRLLLFCRVVILVPRFLLYIRLLLLCRIVILVPRFLLYLRLLLLRRIIILVPRFLLYLRLLLLCRIVILVPRLFFYLRLQLGLLLLLLLLSPICSFFGNVTKWDNCRCPTTPLQHQFVVDAIGLVGVFVVGAVADVIAPISCPV
ncbi:unnamed protein product [Tenebrio molitor]|nr:unnamed protein product [Tenebrio molitor]